MPPLRLFFALWPVEALRIQIESVAKTALGNARGQRITSRNYHITLLFLGSVASDRLPLVTSIAARQQGSTFDLTLDRMERWRPGIVWLASETPTTLTALVAGLRNDFASNGFVVEDRPYRPHVTLMRNVEDEVPLLAPPPLRWTVENFALVESQLARGGSEYRTIETWPLRRET